MYPNASDDPEITECLDRGVSFYSQTKPEDASILKGMLKTDFKEGTLVEYLDGAGFDVEWGRARITEVALLYKEGYIPGIAFRTDGEAHLSLASISDITEIKQDDDVFYLEINAGGMPMASYAVAPKGIEIPRKPLAGNSPEKD